MGQFQRTVFQINFCLLRVTLGFPRRKINIENLDNWKISETSPLVDFEIGEELGFGNRSLVKGEVNFVLRVGYQVEFGAWDLGGDKEMIWGHVKDIECKIVCFLSGLDVLLSIHHFF